MDGVGMYRSGRERFVALGRGLTEEQGGLIVAATPAWTVKDNYAHMAGVADDILSGRLDGVATDPWTQAQVDARADRTLAEVIDELEGHGPAMDAAVEAIGDAMDPRLFIDQWTHEQDVRGAVDVPGGGSADVVAWAAPSAIDGWVRRVARNQLPSLRVVCDGSEFASGDDPEVTLAVDPFTALRVTTGRRSAAQLAALDWTGTDDPSPWFESLVVFSIAAHDVHDAC